MKHALRFLSLAGLALLLWASHGAAVPAGFQEFYLPLPAVSSRSIFVNIDNDPVVSAGMHYAVGVTASANNTKVYYDHWENGLLTGAAGDEIVILNQGQFHVFESSNIPTSPRGTGIYYDGGDRLFIAGSLLQVVVSIWPESPGTVFTDAWEVYPVQAWETQYVSPMGENLSGSYPDFTKVWMLVMSGTDGNSVQITDPAGPGLTTTLNRGQTITYEVRGAGTTVTATQPVQVHMMTGRPRSGTASEMRGYTLVPRAYWSNDYVAPVPSWSNPNANTNLLIYNPNSATITINFEDKNGSGSFTVPANGVRDYRTGAGRYVPVNSGARLQSSDIFWAVAMCDTGSATYDWGYSLIPINFLTTNNYISWAPGTSQPIPTSNGSPVYITAMENNTTVFIDYGPNDGVWDATYVLNKLDVIQVRDPDNNNSGMHIVSNKLIAIAWGESPNYAQAGTPYLDMGYTTLPLPTQWIDIFLDVQKDIEPEELQIEDEALFTIVVSVPSTAWAGMMDVDVVDRLPPGWEYVLGSGNPSDPTSITGDINSGYVLTWDLNWTINPGESRVLTFRARATSLVDPTVPNRNVVEATGEAIGTTLTADDDIFVTIKTPDLTVNKTHTGDFIVGTNGTYTITVTNIGSGSTTGTITVTDTLPAGLGVISGTGAGWSCSAVGQIVTCTNPGPLAPNASSTITLTVSVGPEAVPSVTNSVTVSTPNDSNPNNNSDDDPTNVLATDLAIEKTHTGDFAVGTTGIYTITVTNVGTGPTTGTITVTDTLPTGLSFVSGTGTNWTCFAIGQTVTCTNPGPLAPSASSTITLTVNVESSAYPSVTNSATVSTPGDINPDNNSDDDPTTITAPDLAVVKSHVGNFVVGQNGVYTITITNIGTAPTTGTITAIDLPPGMTFVSGTGPGWACSPTPPTITCVNHDPLPPGGSTVITLTVYVTPSAYPGSVNTVTVSTPNDTDPTNDTYQDPTDVDPVADLRLTKVVDNPNPSLGDTITYTVTVTNDGPNTATGVEVTDQLPAGLTFVSATPSQGSYNNVTGVWTVGTLNSGASATLVIQAIVSSLGTITNIAEVTASNELDPDSTPNNNDPNEDDYAAVTTPAQLADLSLQKSVDNPTPGVGSTVTFTITVRNDGPNAATNVAVQDQLPAGLALVSATPSQGSYNSVTGVWAVGTLPSGATATLTLVATVTAPGVITNIAEVIGVDQPDPDSVPNNSVPAEDDQDDAPINGQPADLTITKSHAGSFAVGYTGTYTLTVTNIGAGSTTGPIIVTDTLPTGLTFVSGTGPGWTCSAALQVVTCTNPGPLGPGESSTITITVSVSGAAFPSVTNSATVSTPDDGDPNNNSDDDPTDVVAPDLQITKSHTGDFTVGSTGIYTITVTNVGSGLTHGPIVVTDTLPTGLTFVSGTGPGWTCSAALQTVTCTNPGPLAPGASTTITLTVSVSREALGSVINTVTVFTPDDTTSNNNSDDDPTNVELGLGQICGFKWLDLDADGNRAENEPYLPGITITLTGVDIFGNPVTLSTVTDENGQYCFTGLVPGTYVICEAPPEEIPYFETFPVSGPVCPNGTIGWLITLGDGQNLNRIKFGNVMDEPTLVPLSVTAIQAVAAPQAVYFRAIGQGIKEIAVELFDLSGRAIYRSDWQKNNLVWAYQNERAERVAPGVYLYFMSVKGYDGTVIKTELRKLVVSPTPSVVDQLLAKAVPKILVLAQREGVQFKLLGQGIREFSVQVFDLSGRPVYTSDWTSTSLIWKLQNSKGQRLAQGVYIYVIAVRDSKGEITRTKLQKLIVK